MNQSVFNRIRSQSQSTSLFNGKGITRPMLLNACDDVEHELRRLLRRQRWLNLEKLLRKVIHW